MKIVLVTLTITLSVMLAHQDNKVKELENQLNKIEVEYKELENDYDSYLSNCMCGQDESHDPLGLDR